jgi:hypothetical protein
LVHVDIEASVGSPPVAVQALKPRRAPRVTDALLNPDRAPAAVSFGGVRWDGRWGRLILLNGNAGGEQSGHLIFYFRTGGMNYDVSLHAWASVLRISGRGMTRLISAPKPGPALPHVIASLKAIIGSALEH